MGQEWFVAIDGKTTGPFSSKDLKDMAAAKKIGPHDHVWTAGMDKWKEARKVVGLFESDKSEPPPVPAPASAGPPPMPVAAATMASPTSASPVIPSPSPAMEAQPPSLSKPKKGVRWGRVAAGILGVIVLIRGAMVGYRQAGGGNISKPSTGTVTFAEDVDSKTMRTTHEGTQFYPGRLFVIIRSPKAFGDSKLLVYLRLHGTEMWAVCGEQIVDPKWTFVAMPDELDDAGSYDIKVTTSKGDLVAESTVTIVSR